MMALQSQINALSDEELLNPSAKLSFMSNPNGGANLNPGSSAPLAPQVGRQGGRVRARRVPARARAFWRLSVQVAGCPACGLLPGGWAPYTPVHTRAAPRTGA